jgi:alanine racemase
MPVPSPHVRVQIDLSIIRANVERIHAVCGVPVIAVVKSDAYGHGVVEVARAVADLVDRFCVFSAKEAADANLWELTGKPALAIGPPTLQNPEDYHEVHVRPAVSNAEQADALREALPILCIDTGQQRFACPIEDVADVLRTGDIHEAYTHASSLEQVKLFADAVADRTIFKHAAGSSLLHESAARFDAVRPGLAIYRGAARVSTRLVEVHETRGPAGYSRFTARRHGIILAGYAHGLKYGPCRINGGDLRLLEVGMQSAFVELNPEDRVGDEVFLLGDGLTENLVADAWNVSPHEALLRLVTSGMREY